MGHTSSKPHPHAISTGELQAALAAYNGRHVSLYCEASGGHVHSDGHHKVNARGKEHESHWKLHHHSNNTISLEQKHHAGHFLRADHHSVTGNGQKGDHHTHFTVVHHHESGHVTLRSHDGHGLGFEHNGDVKAPSTCGEGKHTHLRFEFH